MKAIVSMYLFNNHEDGLNKQTNRLPVAASPIMRKKQTLFEALTGEERPRSIGSLLFILVALLHLWAALWLLQPVEPITLAQPLMMEVSLVSAPGKQVTAAPPAPPKPQKPAIKKPVARKQAKLPKPEAVSDAMLPAPSLTESLAEALEATTDAATSPTAQSASGTQGNAEPYSEASFNANYGSNPKPQYPAIARRRDWQGKVLLRVSVSAEGLSEAVAIQRSSGHDALDESAVAAVTKWKFIPAKRGVIAVASSVIVPIIFTLNH